MSAEAILQEANVQLVQEFNTLFFQSWPTDARYLSVEYTKHNPLTAVNGNIK